MSSFSTNGRASFRLNANQLGGVYVYDCRRVHQFDNFYQFDDPYLLVVAKWQAMA